MLFLLFDVRQLILHIIFFLFSQRLWRFTPINHAEKIPRIVALRIVERDPQLLQSSALIVRRVDAERVGGGSGEPPPQAAASHPLAHASQSESGVPQVERKTHNDVPVESVSGDKSRHRLLNNLTFICESRVTNLFKTHNACIFYSTLFIRCILCITNLLKFSV